MIVVVVMVVVVPAVVGMAVMVGFLIVVVVGDCNGSDGSGGGCGSLFSCLKDGRVK
jgi:hypothetical protein